MSNSSIIIEARRLSRSVLDRGKTREIVSDVSFAFRAGELYTVLGESGAGKSSLLRLLNRLDEPDSGTVVFDGKDYREYAPCGLRLQVGFLFETPYLFPLTVADNLLYADPELTPSQCERLLEQSGLPADYYDKEVITLSSGERQRVAIARLLATNPKVLLLDEPTSRLDPRGTDLIERLVLSLVDKAGLCVIMVTHFLEQAVRLGGQSLLMSGGRIVESGPSAHILRNPSSDEGRAYIEKVS